MTIRIDYPFSAQFQVNEFGSNSRELRTQVLQTYLLNCGMELGGEVESFHVESFNGDSDGEFWSVRAGK